MLGTTTKSASSTAQTAGPGRRRSLAMPSHRPGIEILPHNLGDRMSGRQSQQHAGHEGVPGRTVSRRGMEPHQRDRRGGQHDRQEQRGPRAGRVPSRHDKPHECEWQEGSGDAVAEDLEHPDRREPVGLERRLAGGKRGLALQGQGLRRGANPSTCAIGGLVPRPPLSAMYGPTRNTSPPDQEREGAPPPGPVDPGRPRDGQDQQGRRQGQRARASLRDGSDRRALRNRWPAAARGTAPRAGTGRPPTARRSTRAGTCSPRGRSRRSYPMIGLAIVTRQREPRRLGRRTARGPTGRSE